MKKQKQTKAHLKVWLLLGKSITPDQCLKKWKARRLASYINRLRNEGMDIITEMVTDKRTGDTFARYKLAK